MKALSMSLSKKTFLLAALVFAIIFSLTVFDMPSKNTTEASASEPGFAVVEVKGVCEGEFTEFSSIGSSSEIIEHRSTTNPGSLVTTLVPGRMKQLVLELTRVAISKDLSFYNWRKLVEDGKITNARKDVTVTLYESDGEIHSQWRLLRAWPSAIEYETANGLNLERITIGYEAYQRLR